MKKAITLLIFIFRFFHSNAQNPRDAFLGTYNYTGYEVTYYPPPPDTVFFTGIIYLTSSLTDSTEILFYDTTTTSNISFLCTQDSLMILNDPQPTHTGYGQLFSNDSLYVIGNSSGAMGLTHRTVFFGKKITTSLQETLINNFIISPNPVSGNLIIKPTSSISNASIQVLNIAGQQLFTNQYKNISSTIVIDVSKFRTGIYFLKINTANSINTYKFLVR